MSDPRKRRSLTHVGGEIEVAGDAEEAIHLSRALDVSSARDDDDRDDDPARAHVHGFHSYPARMHPQTAARLAHDFTQPGDTVLDPFCGSGTVLVEAMIAGRRATGTDLNPLAVLLAKSKTRPRAKPDLDAVLDAARACAETADRRRVARAGATRRFPPEDVHVFEPHVLLELDSLREGIARNPDSVVRNDLWLVLSALLVKLSKKRGDTTDEVAARRTAAGYTAKLFVKKTEELTRRLEELTSLFPTPPPPAARVALDDATKLKSIGPRDRVDAVITSPPYAATYDYVAHHALRMRWLGLDARSLEEGEIGARRNYRRATPGEAHEAWSGELSRFLKAIARVLPSGAPAVLIMADSAVGDVALRVDEIVAGLARQTGFIPAALASQARPHFHASTARAFEDRPRREHALVLRRA